MTGAAPGGHVSPEEVTAALIADMPAIQALSREQGAQELASRLRGLVGDWQANSGSRALGDPSADVWNEAARQLLAVLDEREPTGW